MNKPPEDFAGVGFPAGWECAEALGEGAIPEDPVKMDGKFARCETDIVNVTLQTTRMMIPSPNES
ncbi:hypothetical protein F1880_002718 [Penicillium rolfsii]|nr:hypothetical protein F1880_002718 [Penicillium rolfsii]